MDFVIDEIFRAIGYLFIAGIVVFAWREASKAAEKEGYKKVLWKGFLWCAVIALFAGLTLGNPTCEVQGDPVYGGCEQYADDDYEATGEQRFGRFMYFLTLLYLPVVFGTLDGKKKAEWQKHLANT